MSEPRYPVRLDPCIKWAAKDSSGKWWVYTERPQYNNDRGFWVSKVGSWSAHLGAVLIPNCAPAESLMKLVEIDGVQYWEKVE